MMIELKHAPKVGNGELSRTVAPLDTYHRILPLMPAIGLTHIVDLTDLDVLGIPMYVGFGSDGVENQLLKFKAKAPEPIQRAVESALARAETFLGENSDRGHEPIFVAGKGPTSLDAKVSAMMEAVERFSARKPTTRPVVASFNEMKKDKKQRFLDPRLLMLQSPATFEDDQQLEWVIGTWIGAQEEIWVPVDAATFCYPMRQPARICNDTPTGLGAGNTIEEAVCHGLAEAIEHDSWAIAVARGSLASAEDGILALLLGKSNHDGNASSAARSQEGGAFVKVDLDSIGNIQPLAGMINHIREAGVNIHVYWITSDLGIPTFSVSIDGMGPGQEGGGLGAHPDSRIALSRAITEAVQQRLINGARDYFPGGQMISRWQSIFWENSLLEDTCGFQDIQSKSSINILDDIRYMLGKLADRNIDQVIVVDLTKPALNIPTVKVIVPGLADYWTAKTTPDWRALGPRVRRFLPE